MIASCCLLKELTKPKSVGALAVVVRRKQEDVNMVVAYVQNRKENRSRN